jgi:hypothetical protein
MIYVFNQDGWYEGCLETKEEVQAAFGIPLSSIRHKIHKGVKLIRGYIIIERTKPFNKKELAEVEQYARLWALAQTVNFNKYLKNSLDM